MRAARAGEAVLRDAAGATLRLRWPAAGEARFALPRGDYRLVTYRLVEGAWHLSVTGELATAQVGEAPATLEATDRVQVEARAVPRGGEVRAQVAIRAARGGATIYREGRRVQASCVLLDGAGAEVGAGPLRYG